MILSQYKGVLTITSSKLNLNQDQINQMKNISDTLIEATEHFSKYIKDREQLQSINIFSAIVEGFQAIQTMYIAYKIEDTSIITRIEKDLIAIGKELENNNFLKTAEIIQFSLMPRLRKLHGSFSTSANKKTITIGVYHEKENPNLLYTKERINALNKESVRQHTTLIYFSAEGVDFENKKIQGLTFTDNEWQEIEADFPDVVNNTDATNRHQQSITERKLRRMIPFTSFHVGNKFYLPRVMVKHRQFANLLVPFKMVRNKQIVYDYLEQEKIVVAKPILGARGESIYFIQKKGNRFTVTDHRIERIYNKEKFDGWIDQVLLRQKFSYMVQRYVDCRTKDREPYDIRAHMQKNEHNEWQITRIYPRIGSKESILSNISRGGRTQELTEFLITQFGKNIGKTYDEKLRTLSVDLTNYLDRIHNFSLDELGLDLAIDNTGRFWLHEANNGPQTTYHEEERAVNMIGYAKYIAKNGIVKSNQFTLEKGQFNAKTSDLPFADVDERYRIGMLKNNNDDEELAIACAYVAHYENVQYYTFSPKDIDYNEMLIKGRFYESNKWIEKIVEYPDVIYDRFRLRGVKQFNNVYEELEGIPFNNEFYGNSISKLEVYDKLRETGKVDDVLIPYKKVEDFNDILQFINQYHQVIVKPKVSSFAEGVHYISLSESDNYLVADKHDKQEYSRVALQKLFNGFMKSHELIVQQYIPSRTIDDAPFDIRVHLMKDDDNKWALVNLFPRIGVNYVASTGLFDGSYRGEFIGLIKRNFPKQDPETIKNKIKKTTLEISHIFETLYENSFNEIAFDIALDEECKPLLFELNVNKPGILNYEFDIARHAIPNAIYMAKQVKTK